MACTYPEAAHALFSPSLSETKATPRTLQDAQYLNALDAEHSRDLYLQGVMAVGQIARLLENLCSQDECKFDEDVSESVAAVLIEENSDCRSGFVSYQEPGSIEAWCLAVAFAHGREHTTATDVEADFEDHKACPRASFVPEEVIEIQDDLDDHQDCTISTSVLAKVPNTKIPGPQSIDADHDCDLAIRIAELSARLDRLGDHIEEFSKERSDALTQLDMVLTEGMDSGIVSTDGVLKVDDPGFCVQHCSQEDVFVSRVWTATTITSDFTLVTPPEMETAIPLQHKSATPCFWSYA